MGDNTKELELIKRNLNYVDRTTRKLNNVYQQLTFDYIHFIVAVKSQGQWTQAQKGGYERMVAYNVPSKRLKLEKKSFAEIIKELNALNDPNKIKNIHLKSSYAGKSDPFLMDVWYSKDNQTNELYPREIHDQYTIVFNNYYVIELIGRANYLIANARFSDQVQMLHQLDSAYTDLMIASGLQTPSAVPPPSPPPTPDFADFENNMNAAGKEQQQQQNENLADFDTATNLQKEFDMFQMQPPNEINWDVINTDFNNSSSKLGSTSIKSLGSLGSFGKSWADFSSKIFSTQEGTTNANMQWTFDEAGSSGTTSNNNNANNAAASQSSASSSAPEKSDNHLAALALCAAAENELQVELEYYRMKWLSAGDTEQRYKSYQELYEQQLSTYNADTNGFDDKGKLFYTNNRIKTIDNYKPGRSSLLSVSEDKSIDSAAKYFANYTLAVEMISEARQLAENDPQAAINLAENLSSRLAVKEKEQNTLGAFLRSQREKQQQANTNNNNTTTAAKGPYDLNEETQNQVKQAAQQAAQQAQLIEEEQKAEEQMTRIIATRKAEQQEELKNLQTQVGKTAATVVTDKLEARLATMTTAFNNASKEYLNKNSNKAYSKVLQESMIDVARLNLQKASADDVENLINSIPPNNVDLTTAKGLQNLHFTMMITKAVLPLLKSDESPQRRKANAELLGTKLNGYSNIINPPTSVTTVTMEPKMGQQQAQLDPLFDSVVKGIEATKIRLSQLQANMASNKTQPQQMASSSASSSSASNVITANTLVQAQPAISDELKERLIKFEANAQKVFNYMQNEISQAEKAIGADTNNEMSDYGQSYSITERGLLNPGEKLLSFETGIKQLEKLKSANLGNINKQLTGKMQTVVDSRVALNVAVAMANKVCDSVIEDPQSADNLNMFAQLESSMAGVAAEVDRKIASGPNYNLANDAALKEDIEQQQQQQQQLLQQQQQQQVTSSDTPNANAASNDQQQQQQEQLLQQKVTTTSSSTAASIITSGGGGAAGQQQQNTSSSDTPNANAEASKAKQQQDELLQQQQQELLRQQQSSAKPAATQTNREKLTQNLNDFISDRRFMTGTKPKYGYLFGYSNSRTANRTLNMQAAGMIVEMLKQTDFDYKKLKAAPLNLKKSMLTGNYQVTLTGEKGKPVKHTIRSDELKRIISEIDRLSSKGNKLDVVPTGKQPDSTIPKKFKA